MKQTYKHELRDAISRLFKPLVILLILGLFGMTGFMLVENMNAIDALYMTVISLTTVGFETVHPLSKAGKVFTCIYLLFSVVIFLYLASEFAKRVISFNIKEILTKDKWIQGLKI